jgi:hypothetical protein
MRFVPKHPILAFIIPRKGRERKRREKMGGKIIERK